MNKKERDETMSGVISSTGVALILIGAWQLFGSAVALIAVGILLVAIGNHMYIIASKP